MFVLSEQNKIIIDKLGKSEDLIDFVKDRPGHDQRYAVDTSNIKMELGWEPEYNFEEGIAETIDWYLDNTGWIENCITGEYLEYYQRNYGG